VRVAVKKIPGVREATVSLKDGVAHVAFAPDNGVKLARLWKVVRDNGFTPRSASLVVAGSLVARGDTLWLAVGGSGDVFVLQATGAELAALRGQPAGAALRLRGDVPEGAARANAAKPPLMVRGVEVR